MRKGSTPEFEKEIKKEKNPQKKKSENFGGKEGNRPEPKKTRRRSKLKCLFRKTWPGDEGRSHGKGGVCSEGVKVGDEKTQKNQTKRRKKKALQKAQGVV